MSLPSAPIQESEEPVMVAHYRHSILAIEIGPVLKLAGEYKRDEISSLDATSVYAQCPCPEVQHHVIYAVAVDVTYVTSPAMDWPGVIAIHSKPDCRYVDVVYVEVRCAQDGDGHHGQAGEIMEETLGDVAARDDVENRRNDQAGQVTEKRDGNAGEHQRRLLPAGPIDHVR